MVSGGRALRKWLGHECAGLRHGARACKRKTQKALIPWAMWGHQEKIAICDPESAPSPGTEFAWHLDLGLQFPELWELHFRCWLPTSLWCSAAAACTDWASAQRVAARVVISFYPVGGFLGLLLDHKDKSIHVWEDGPQSGAGSICCLRTS